VLQRGNIQIKTSAEGEVGVTLDALRESAATAAQTANLTLATDGKELQAEVLEGGQTVAYEFPNFANHFGCSYNLVRVSIAEPLYERR